LINISPAAHSQAGSPAGIITVTIADNHPDTRGNDPDYTTETHYLNHATGPAASYITFASYDANGNGILEQVRAQHLFHIRRYEASGSSLTPSIWRMPGEHSRYFCGGKEVHNWAQKWPS